MCFWNVTPVRLVMASSMVSAVTAAVLLLVSSSVRRGRIIVRAHDCFPALVLCLPAPVGLVLFSALHYRQLLVFLTLLQGLHLSGLADIPDIPDVPDFGDRIRQDDGSSTVTALVHAVVMSGEPDAHCADDVCPVCLDTLADGGIHVDIVCDPTDAARVNVRLVPHKVMLCRQCRRGVHLTCMLQYLLTWGSSQRCPLCTACPRLRMTGINNGDGTLT